MKKILLTFLTVGILFTSCKKEPISFNPNQFNTIGVYDGPLPEFPIENSDNNIQTINTFQGWECDTFKNSPAMCVIGIFWEGGEETTIGIFSWEINHMVMCEDGVQVNSNEFFLYKHDGIGEIIDYQYEILQASSELFIDTVSLFDIYGFPYSNNDNSVVRFYSNIPRPLNIKITSLTVENKYEN